MRAELDLCRTMRSAYRDTQGTLAGWCLAALGEVRAQLRGSLFESQTPVVEHVAVLGAAYATRDVIETRVLVGMQPHHIDDGRKRRNENRRAGDGRCDAVPLP